MQYKTLALVPPGLYYFRSMSTREALIQEILKQPEHLLRELQHYLNFLQEQHKGGTNGVPAPAAEGWPPGYFQNTAGAFAGEPLARPPQLPFEKREEWEWLFSSIPTPGSSNSSPLNPQSPP